VASGNSEMVAIAGLNAHASHNVGQQFSALQ
jgi:hypothetical protein